jgi:hypothetical protein
MGRTAVIAGTASAVSKHVARRQQERYAQQGRRKPRQSQRQRLLRA